MRRRAPGRVALLAALSLAFADGAAADPCGTAPIRAVAGAVAVWSPLVRGGLAARDGTIRLAAIALAGQLRSEADQAAGWGLSTIPDAIRRDLDGRVPDDVMDAARWRVGPARSVLLRLLFGPGDAIAVALGETIVFRDVARAADTPLWAHELEHVAQHRRLGPLGFAEAYVRCPGRMEAEARAAARRVAGN